MLRVIFLSLLLLSTNVWAASTPEQVVNEMLTKMKSAKNFSPIIDYIHWPTAYKQMSQNQANTAFVANSPEELKKVVSEFVLDPAAVVKKKFVPSLGSLPAEQKANIEQMLQQQLAEVDRQAKARNADLAKAVFVVKSSTVNGGQAKVEVEQTIEDKVENWTLNLQQIDGSWYLPVFDPSFANSTEQALMQ